MSKNESKIKQREYLSNIIQKIKQENNYDYSFSNIDFNLKKKKQKKIMKRPNLKLNDSLSKEMQDLTPKNTKSTINYEKILDKYEHPIDLNSLSNSNKQIINTIETNKLNKDSKENINQIDSKNKTIENDDTNNYNIKNKLVLNMKNKIEIFLKIMKKYSEIFNNIINNILLSDKIKIEKNEKINIENKSKNELIKIIKQFNKLISNPKLSENFFMSNDDNNFLEEKINEIIKEEKNIDFKKKDLDNLIEIYESKINILISENEILKLNKEKQNNFQDDLIQKNKELEKENNELKIIINENDIKKENLLKKYNEIKNKITRIENDNSILIKENQELKNEILNKNYEMNKNEEVNSLKNELSYKNSIIKYLEEILYNYNNNKENEDSLRDEYDKNKKKIKKQIEKNKNKVNKTNKKKLKLNDQLMIKNDESNEDLKEKEIDFEFNNETITNNLNDLILSKEKMKDTEDKKNVEPLKKEIENLDEEILEIQTKLKEMLKK